MLISHSHQFIFIHIYKNGGSSINEALAAYNHYSFKRSGVTDKLRFILGIYPRVYASAFSGHERAVIVQKELTEKLYNAYFKFAFVRHPVAWQKSLYRYAVEDPRHHQHVLTKSFKGFDEYVDWRIDGNFQTQKSFVVNESNEQIVDYIGKLEKFEDHFKNVTNLIGIHDVSLPHVNKSNSRSVGVSAESRSKIEKCFEEDFIMFEYE